MRIAICVTAAALTSITPSITQTAAAGTMTPVSSFGSNPGALQMYEYIPANLPSGRPLVVVLHGCTQTASAMDAAGWNKLADAHGFAVLYPEQETANNPVRCFNWAGEYGDTANLVRGMGENQSIISMIDTEIATHGVDTNRVYIAGFSAGAAFVAVMLATWPDRFAGAAIMSGLPYRCATSVNGAYSCQNPGVTKSAAEWGDLARMAYSYSGKRAHIQIWHGGADTTVATMNQGELVKQWTNVFGVDQTADATETIGKATRSEYRDGSTLILETYTIMGMGHAVAIGGDGCPATAGAYFSDAGICSTTRAAAFFGLLGGSGPGDGSGSGSGSGSSGGGDDGGGGSNNQDLPGCGLSASGNAASSGTLLLVALCLVVRRRR
jgi:poly(hydroxyalkanoate) depolymerase family esterase